MVRLRQYLTTAKRPTAKDTKVHNIKRYLMKYNDITIAKDGCLVAMKRDGRLNSKELVVVPEDISLGLLYAMHLNLNHPSQFQLLKVVDTRFFMLDREQKIRDLVKNCTLYQSVAKLPEEIHSFKPNIMPDHPGQAFTVDILKARNKKILVATDNFQALSLQHL